MQSYHKAMRAQIYRGLLRQSAVLVLVALVIGLWQVSTAYAVFAGGMIALLANGLFAGLLFSFQPGDARVTLRRFYRAEVAKIVFSVVVLALSLGYLPLAFFPFFISYALTLFSVSLGLLRFTAIAGVVPAKTKPFWR